MPFGTLPLPRGVRTEAEVPATQGRLMVLSQLRDGRGGWGASRRPRFGWRLKIGSRSRSCRRDNPAVGSPSLGEFPVTDRR